MKSSHFFSVLLFIAICGTFTVTAETSAPQTSKKSEKTEKQKKNITVLTLEEATKIATTPTLAPRRTHRLNLKKKYTAANKDKIKILMLGDSITQQWEDKSAAEAHKKYIAPYNVLNLGFNGDRTENTLWVIEKSGILEMINPKLVTILIGTNNRNHYLSTVAGIKKILTEVRKRYPDAKILLYAIFPRGGNNKHWRRMENEKVNAEIVKFCNGNDIIWVDIRKKFVSPEGILDRTLLPDTLHPKYPKGYSVWGESLKPYFEKYGK